MILSVAHMTPIFALVAQVQPLSLIHIFLRLKTIEAGYNTSAISALFNARIYFTCENAFVLSAFKLWDPEVGSNGLNYPLNRSFNIGAQLSF